MNKKTSHKLVRLPNNVLVDRLLKEARLQAIIHKKQVIPKQMGSILWVMASYPWQSLLGLSLITSVFIEIVW